MQNQRGVSGMHAVISLSFTLHLDSFCPLITRTALQHGFFYQWHRGEQRSEITKHPTREEVSLPPEEMRRQERIKSGRTGT